MFFYIAFFILYLPVILLFPTKVIHKERMPKGKAIVTCNHYSNADCLVVISKFKRKFWFLSKIELFKNKIIAFFMKSFGTIPVNRNQVAPSTFKETLTHLKKGHQVFIFPEGTRNKEGTEELHQVKQGAITFASKGDAVIVPMVIYQKPKVFRKNYIIVGEPIKVQGENPSRLTKDEIATNIEIYSDAMKALRTEIDEYVNSKKKGRKNGHKN